MITHISFPLSARSRELPFYLAAEEFAALSLPVGSDYFFMWRVRPTVIIGRNQMFESEVNAAYCRDNDIDICRRKSGGGCVYADLSNIMFSFITDCGPDLSSTFAAYTARVAAMLRSLGIDATAGSRNDVTVGGRKVSGNAFYRLPGGRSIAHGTMLFDVDIERMMNAITPSRVKLESKGVSSVRSRVTSVREFRPDLTIDAFMDYARTFMSDGDLSLSAADIAVIERIEAPYLTDRWLLGKSPRGSLSLSRRIDGVGDFAFDLVMRGGVIEDINLAGDFFLLADLDTSLLRFLRGARLLRESLSAALTGVDASRVIMGLSNDALIEMLIS
ncbi:MAG: lipoyltransferase [Bacteroides sp.]|nr:lipoyltransferase [Bacteroides sp.]